jgi:3-oxoacyl-ACP reductase-like protein
MGFFEDILGGIFGGPAKAATPAAAQPTAAPATPAAPAPAGAPAAPASAPAASVDVAAILDAKVKASGQTLDWRRSIVDLMKALGIDSSLTARKALAAELGYDGDTADSAKMNLWLHKQVIQKLKDNGGTVPADLL